MTLSGSIPHHTAKHERQVLLVTELLPTCFSRAFAGGSSAVTRDTVVKGRPACSGPRTRRSSGQRHAQDILQNRVVADNGLAGGSEGHYRRECNRSNERDVFHGHIAVCIRNKGSKRGQTQAATQVWVSGEVHHTCPTQRTCHSFLTRRTRGRTVRVSPSRSLRTTAA